MPTFTRFRKEGGSTHQSGAISAIRFWACDSEGPALLFRLYGTDPDPNALRALCAALTRSGITNSEKCASMRP
jgi:hypothetical protein